MMCKVTGGEAKGESMMLLSRLDEDMTDVTSAMCVFWDLEAASSTLYRKMAECETHPVRAEAWRKLQNQRLILGHSRTNHDVYLSHKLLASCREMIQLVEQHPAGEPDPFHVMAALTQLKFLQVMLMASLRQQISVVGIIDVETFSASVAYVTKLVLTSRCC